MENISDLILSMSILSFAFRTNETKMLCSSACETYRHCTCRDATWTKTRVCMFANKWKINKNPLLFLSYYGYKTDTSKKHNVNWCIDGTVPIKTHPSVLKPNNNIEILFLLWLIIKITITSIVPNNQRNCERKSKTNTEPNSLGIKGELEKYPTISLITAYLLHCWTIFFITFECIFPFLPSRSFV